MGLAGGLRPTGSATLLLAFVAFVNLGLPDALLDVAWPDLRRDLLRAQQQTAQRVNHVRSTA
jgi:hypothetical protein